MQKSITQSSTQTQKLGESLAKKILSQPVGKTARVLCLQGDLGAGKTTFLQGFAKGLGIKDVINSPTFVIMKRFKIHDLRFKNFYHFDCYRLESEADLEIFGFAEILADSKNIVAIEWPERISAMLPKDGVRISLSHQGPTQRSLSIKENIL